MVEFIYHIKFFEEDGTFIDSDGFVIEVDDYDTPEGAEEAGDEASTKAEDKAEDLMIMYDAHSYELSLEDVH